MPMIVDGSRTDDHSRDADDSDRRTPMIKAMAYGRIVLGATFLIVPRLALRHWPGPVEGSTRATSSVAGLLARSVGGRDVALGVGTLMALRHGSPTRGWLEAGVVADATDAVAIGIALRHLPKGRALAMMAGALGAAVMGRRLGSSS